MLSSSPLHASPSVLATDVRLRIASWLQRAGGTLDARMMISEVAADTSATRHFAIVDALGVLRHTLLNDGSVVDPRGELIAYIEADGSVGDVNLEYMGEVTSANANSVGFITNADDELLGEVRSTAPALAPAPTRNDCS